MKKLYSKIMKQKATAIGKFFLLAPLLVVASISSALAQSSLVTAPHNSVQDWLNQFVGPNVKYFNESIQCPQNEYGYFSDGNTTNLGIDRGLILATCPVTAIDDVVGTFVAAGVSAPGHPILTAICGFNTNDACVIQFDFTADIDTVTGLTFDYVFGSEEYPEYACSSFNDPFAFIVSGPGIPGNLNIATVPGTTIPVTINSVNMAPNGTFFSITNCNNMGPGAPFSQYYVDNQGLNGQDIVFDGHTTVLTTAEALIQPCDTYHMFLGVSNASDGAFQTGVFIKEKSFSVDSTTIDLAGLVNSGGGYLIEGCTPLVIEYAHDTTVGRPKKVCFHYAGSAQMLTDYQFLPDSLMIPAHVYADSLVVFPIADGMNETINIFDPNTGNLTQTITDTLKIYEISCCTRDTLNPIDSMIIPIRDSLYMNLITTDTFYCEGSIDTTVMHVTGDPIYSYVWTPGTSIGNPLDTLTWAYPLVTTTYTVTATYPGCPSISRNVTISIEPLPLVEIAIEDTALCLTEPLHLNTTVDPPNNPQAPYTYSWAPADGNLSSTSVLEPDFWYNGAGVFTYMLSVTTPNGCLGTDSIRIEAYPGIIADIVEEDVPVCSNDSLVIEVDITPPSMEATSSYQWSPSTWLSGDQVLEPTYYTTVNEYNTYVYTLIATNSYGCHDTDQITIRSIVLPQVDVMADTALCLHVPTQINMDVLPNGINYTYNWTPSADLQDATVEDPIFFNPFNTDHADYTLYVAVSEPVYNCTNYDSIHIHTYPHTFLTTIEDQLIKYDDYVNLWADGAKYYIWNPPAYLDNPSINAPVAHGVEPVIYTVYGLNEWGCRDTGTVKVDIDYAMDEFVPSVFSPNGDGKNDIFKVKSLRHQKLVEFRVFNRWGKEVYSNVDPNSGWDGTFNGVPQDPGVYHYLIRINVPDGKAKVYKGDITLIR
jgi:gliding motility-associated-like protein